MRELRILHLAKDAHFVDQAIKVFERVAPGCNELFVCGNAPLKNVKSKAKIVSRFKAISGIVSDEIKGYDIAIIHSLNPNWYRVIKKIQRSTVLVWLGWGFDYYDIIKKEKAELFLPLTKKAWYENSRKASLTTKIKSTIRAAITPDKIKIIQGIDIFCPVLPLEYKYVKFNAECKSFPRQGAWNYGNLEEDFIKGFDGQTVSGANLLIGNSASFENNHLDALYLLSEIGIGSRKIIAPLSYGERFVRKLVIAKGKELFAENFEPLIDFMPIQEYVERLRSCGFVIMNHMRQQALGNIVIMLYLGAKVFFNKDCPTFIYLKSQGAVVFSIDELKATPSMLDEQLGKESIAINRYVIAAIWSKDISRNRTRELLEMAYAARK